MHVQPFCLVAYCQDFITAALRVCKKNFCLFFILVLCTTLFLIYGYLCLTFIHVQNCACTSVGDREQVVLSSLIP